eukprot:m.129830 g.129830  ORF g.129830 m.129830 type:complete len:690 (-) comp14586_c0_seq1:558-2627(-)
MRNRILRGVCFSVLLQHIVSNVSGRITINRGPGRPFVHEALSIPRGVMLFGKRLHPTFDILAHYSETAPCKRAGQKWMNISNASYDFTCAFALHNDSSKTKQWVNTSVFSITEQIVGCRHPAAELIPRLLGNIVTVIITPKAQKKGNNTTKMKTIVAESEATYPKLLSMWNVSENDRLYYNSVADSNFKDIIVSLGGGQPVPKPSEIPHNKTVKLSDKDSYVIPDKPFYYCACLTMWYRSEFLLEWARFHKLVHGLAKIFIYDNDSEIDNLKGTSRLLNSTIPIERVWWPQREAQPGYAGHCMLQAGSQCKWVSFFDVDEYAYAWHKDGRLDTVLHMMEENMPQVGGLEIQMIQASHEDEKLIKKPEGGVVRNYLCRAKATNIKSIVRPETIHPSLYSGVHFFCYDEAFKKETLSSSNTPVLIHYSVQAWEVEIRKHMRRASPASLPFSKNVSLDKPSEKWLKKAAGTDCREDAHSLFDLVLCTLSFKQSTCPAIMNKKLLITGCGGTGSGMTWVERSINRAIPVANKELLVSWESAISRPPPFTSRNIVASQRFEKVFHQVRNPLHAISAITTYTTQDWNHVLSVLGFDYRKFKDPIQRALNFWIIWNQVIEFIADWRYKVEDVELSEICLKANISYSCSALETSKDHRTFPTIATSPDLSWETLDAIDPQVAPIAKIMAIRYGYPIQ